MSEDKTAKLIVGLGNPGSAYENTRHNLGFLVVRALADEVSWTFKKERKFKGELASGMFNDQKVFLLLPTTYMNLSGEAVRSVCDFYKIAPSRLIIVADDIDIPYSSLRFRRLGGPGGHNGLKSIEAHLGTREYPRLRVGIGDREHGDLDDHVLGPFSKEEREKLPNLIKESVAFLKQWLDTPDSKELGSSGHKKKEIYEERN